MNATIAIIDDHPIVRHGMISVLEERSEWKVKGEAPSVKEGVDLINALQPDLAIVDLSLTDGNGLDLIKQIRETPSKTKFLVMSMNDESLFAERVLRAGALGYLHKQEAREKLISAVDRVLAGHIFVSEAISSRLFIQAITGKKPLEQSPLSALSDRELEVFELIGKGLSSAEIAEKLKVGVKTVETHRFRIKDKLNLKNAQELIRHATQWYLDRGFCR